MRNRRGPSLPVAFPSATAHGARRSNGISIPQIGRNCKHFPEIYEIFNNAGDAGRNNRQPSSSRDGNRLFRTFSALSAFTRVLCGFYYVSLDRSQPRGCPGSLLSFLSYVPATVAPGFAFPELFRVCLPGPVVVTKKGETGKQETENRRQKKEENQSGRSRYRETTNRARSSRSTWNST